MASFATEPAWSFCDPSDPALGLEYPGGKDPLFVWMTENGVQQALEVFIKVNRSYGETRDIVARALRPKAAETRLSWGELGAPWPETAARVAMLDQLAEVPPHDGQLAQAVRAGAILESEIPWRAKVRALLPETAIPSGLYERNAPVTSHWLASLPVTDLGTSWKATVQIEIVDTETIFGPSTAVIRLTRKDRGPNPAYVSPLRRLAGWIGLADPIPYSFLEGPQQRLIDRFVVPWKEYAALTGALGDAGALPQTAESPKEWIPPPDIDADAYPLPKLLPGRELQPVLSTWKSLGFEDWGMRFTSVIAALPDESLLLVAEPFGDSGKGRYGIIRLFPNPTKWRSTVLWQGDYVGPGLKLSHDGKSAWFIGEKVPEKDRNGYVAESEGRLMFRLHLESGRIESWPLKTTEQSDIWPARIILGAEQFPIALSSDLAYYPDDPATVLSLRSPPPGPTAVGDLPPGSGSVISLIPVLRSAYSRFPLELAGLSQDQNYVVVDESIAEVDARTGRTLRAFPSPWGVRSGVHPRSLLIGKGSKLIVAFSAQIRVSDGGVDYSPGAGGETWSGIQVVDLRGNAAPGTYLVQPGNCGAMASSGGDRLLAIGGRSSDPGLGGILVQSESMRAPYRLGIGPLASEDLHGLAFSWNGRFLWGTSSEGILQWQIDPALWDPAPPMATPEQTFTY